LLISAYSAGQLPQHTVQDSIGVSTQEVQGSIRSSTQEVQKAARFFRAVLLLA
jgi:hypothetical protein